MSVLIINHDKVACGTFQFCKRIYSIVSKSKDISYFYKECVNREDYLSALVEIKPDYIVYNWHKDRINWLGEIDIAENTSAKHYFLFHDGSVVNRYDKYLFFGEFPNYPTPINKERSILLPRPLIDYHGTYPVNDVPTIGSFGFATDHKRFPELVTLVNKTFDKAHIRLHITSPYFGVTKGYNLPDIMEKCVRNNVNPNVKLSISNNFIGDEQLLEFLAGNDINVFNYAYMENPGISSAIDYALSVKRPFAITKNNLFRHVASNSILLENNSIQDIINKGLAPIERFYHFWHTDTFREQFDGLFI
jgi:hypothetical protein